MNELRIFEGNEVEILEVEGRVLFNPYHVGACLDMADRTVRDHIKRMNEKQAIKLTNSDGGLTAVRKFNNAGEYFLTESGVYKLVMNSRKPSAERFQDWVTDEVLPEIRKTGSYAASKVPQTYAEALRAYADEVEEKERLALENNEMKPKALFADSVSASKTSILIGQLAKLIKQNGKEIGQNRLFKWMRDNGYLCKSGENYNMPTQYSMNLELMEVKENSIVNADGSVRITRTTKITGKGQQYFVNKLLDKNY